MLPLVWQPWIDTKDTSLFIPSLGDSDTPDRSDERWSPLYDIIDKKYDTKTKTLKKGTILYHGSLSKTFDYDMQNKPGIYFGLDYSISSWILTESYKKSVHNICKPPYNWKGYVHVFRLKKPLKYIYTKSSGAPFNDINECKDKPCIHAQYIIHESFTSDLWDLGTELTIPSTYNLKDYLEPVEIHELDIVMMYMYMRLAYKGKQGLRFESWSPENAIKKVHYVKKKLT